MIDFASSWLLVATILVLYIIRKCRRDPRKVKLAETLPGPPEWPIIGNGFDFSRKDKLKLMINYKDKYGDTYRVWFGKYLAIALSNVEELEAVFMNSKMLGKPKLFQPYEDFFGDGIFSTQCVQRWRKNRKIFQSLFSRSALPRYTTVVNEKAVFLVNVMKNANLIDGPEFDVWDYLPSLATDIMLSTSGLATDLAFNVDLSWDDKSLVKFYIAAVRGMELCVEKMWFPWLQYGVINHLFYKKEAQQSRKDICDFLKKLVESKKQEILEQIEAHQNKSAASSGDIPPKSVLTLAYELAEVENDENAMYDELLTVLTAGGDPATMMALFLLAVAIHQDIQNKLYDEIFEIFGDSDRPADVYDVDRLLYLDQVIKETLRRFPIIPMILREAEEDVKIGNRVIPEGTMIIVSIPAIHFNPEYYPDPWKFNPDNFSSEVADKRHKLAFLSFSAGLRNCMGIHFAMFEMKIILSTLLRNFAFYTRMKMEDIYMGKEFAMCSVNGYKLTISSRIRRPTYLKK